MPVKITIIFEPLIERSGHILIYYPTSVYFLLIFVCIFTQIELEKEHYHIYNIFMSRFLNILGFCLLLYSTPSYSQVAQLTTANSQDTITNDNNSIKGSKPFLEAEVKYKANDSIASSFESQRMYLFGKAEIEYMDIELTAHVIELDLDSTIALAYGYIDSTGVEQDLPVFKDKSGSYTMRRMKYNFETKKAIIEHIVTEQGEGFVVGQKAKRVNENEYFMRDAKYTTCDNHDHPHFYLNLTKAKVIPGKKTVTGPAYLVVEDVKLPIVVPFALIPSTKSYSSGIIMPSYGDESTRGFFLSEGGYYFAMNEYFDLRLTGDIYTNGSWGSHVATTYKNRYKYSGRFSSDLITNVTSEKDLPDYAKSKDFSVRWNHTQDSKANPYQSFSASVNFSTSSYDRNNVGSIINPIDLSTNQKSSSISYSKRWPTGPFNFSANLLHSQNSRDTSISLTIPDLTLTMNRIYPLKRKEVIGKEKWYEKISFSYSGNTKNYINTKEKDLSISGESLSKEWKNGMKHSIPLSMNLKMLKYFTLSPSFNYTERWYLSKTRQEWDEDQQKIVKKDPEAGFNRVYDYSTSVGTSTKIYTFFKPSRAIFGDGIEAIRHVATPSVSLSYRPDFSQGQYGFYDWIEYFNAKTNEVVRYDYSYYDGYIYGTAGKGRSGSMSLSLGNTLEMKVKSSKDSTGFKKISILESLNFSSSYNFLADSLKWNMINMSGRTKIFGTSISFNATFDPYGVDVNKNNSPVRVNKSALHQNGKLLRLEGASTSFGFNLSPETFKRKEDRSTNSNSNDPNNNEPDGDTPLGEGDLPGRQNRSNTGLTSGEDGYAKFSMPWSLSFNYSLRVSKGKFDPERKEYKYVVGSDVNVTGNISLTPKWKVSMSSGYSFDEKTISQTNFGITRDLHCWSMRFNVVPVGRYKSYFFSINVNSSMLQDLKYEKRNSAYGNSSFYR